MTNLVALVCIEHVDCSRIGVIIAIRHWSTEYIVVLAPTLILPTRFNYAVGKCRLLLLIMAELILFLVKCTLLVIDV